MCTEISGGRQAGLSSHVPALIAAHCVRIIIKTSES